MAVSFLKRGKEAQDAYAKADAEAELRKLTQAARRFWVPKDGSTKVTFLDGFLTPDGLLDTVTYNEHRIYANGSYRNYFPCVAAVEPCPLCEQNDHPSLVSLFTIIDHTKYKDRNEKLHQYERRLFVAKRDTVKRLQKMAAKRGGLAGWTVGIDRTGERSPEVGTDFDFLEQPDLAAFAAKFAIKPEEMKPFDYEKVVPYFTADQLRAKGFGGPVIGKPKPAKASAEPDDEDNESDTTETYNDDL